MVSKTQKKKKKKNRKKLKSEKFEIRKSAIWRYGGVVASRKIWPRSMQQFLRNLR